MSCFLPKDEIMAIKNIDLYTYLKTCYPGELKLFCNGTYTTKTHSSLKISNGLWHYFRGGVGGKNAVDYLIKVEKYDFLSACNKVKKDMNLKFKIRMEDIEKEEKRKSDKLILPPRNDNNNKVINYLIKRGIDFEIIKDCITRGLIYEDYPYSNAIFLGLDTENRPRYCAIRSTNSSNFKRESYGSDKAYSFKLEARNKETTNAIYLFESAIDTLSFATFLRYSNKNYKDYNLISLAGIYKTASDFSKSKLPKTVENFLKNNQQVTKIVLCFDNDFAGRNSTKALKMLLENKYKVIDYKPKIGKDYNDYLCSFLKLHNRRFGDIRKENTK